MRISPRIVRMALTAPITRLTEARQLALDLLRPQRSD